MSKSAKKILWSNVAIYASEGGEVRYPASGESLDAFQARIMDEYRCNGSINDYYLADPADCIPQDDDNAGDELPDGTKICDAGPAVAEIDFTELDAALAAMELENA